MICKDKNGVQRRLRRFDSDPSLQNPVLRRPNKVNDVAKTPEGPIPGTSIIRDTLAASNETIALSWTNPD